MVKFENVAMPVVVLKLTGDNEVDRVPFELHFDMLYIDKLAYHVQVYSLILQLGLGEAV